jgi:hypothetical protein
MKKIKTLTSQLASHSSSGGGIKRKALTIFTTSFILLVLGLTLNSCKDCGKKETEPTGRGGATGNTNSPSNPPTDSTAFKDAVNSAEAAAEEAVKAAAEAEGEKLQVDAARDPLAQALRNWMDQMGRRRQGDSDAREAAREEANRRLDTMNHHFDVMTQRMTQVAEAARRSREAAKKAQSIMVEIRNGGNSGDITQAKKEAIEVAVKSATKADLAYSQSV